MENGAYNRTRHRDQIWGRDFTDLPKLPDHNILSTSNIVVPRILTHFKCCCTGGGSAEDCTNWDKHKSHVLDARGSYCCKNLKTRDMNVAAQMLERETAREKNLEKAQKEAKIRARKDAVAQEPAAAAGAAAAPADADADDAAAAGNDEDILQVMMASQYCCPALQSLTVSSAALTSARLVC